MKCTSAQAAKILRKLKEDYDTLLQKEVKSCIFVAAVGEDLEAARPAYHYEEMQERLTDLEERIRRLKHAVNVFNTTHLVPGFDMTVDEMLVYIPQLTLKKSKLSDMKDRLPKERVSRSYGANAQLIEYTYANYDIIKAEEEFNAVSELLAKAQTALDKVNSTEEMEIDG